MLVANLPLQIWINCLFRARDDCMNYNVMLQLLHQVDITIVTLD